jgi:hypothetical protein
LINVDLVGGFNPTPLKNDGQLVSWDDEIPNIWKNEFHVPNHQPVMVDWLMFFVAEKHALSLVLPHLAGKI